MSLFRLVGFALSVIAVAACVAYVFYEVAMW